MSFQKCLPQLNIVNSTLSKEEEEEEEKKFQSDVFNKITQKWSPENSSSRYY